VKLRLDVVQLLKTYAVLEELTFGLTGLQLFAQLEGFSMFYFLRQNGFTNLNECWPFCQKVVRKIGVQIFKIYVDLYNQEKPDSQW
jgi:hypothetical protein